MQLVDLVLCPTAPNKFVAISPLEGNRINTNYTAMVDWSESKDCQVEATKKKNVRLRYILLVGGNNSQQVEW